MSKDYKSYSLNNLREVVADAITSEATPEEVYVCLLNSIRNQIEYNESCIRSAKRLLELLGDTTDNNDMSWATEWTPNVTDNKVSTRRRHSDLDAL